MKHECVTFETQETEEAHRRFLFLNKKGREYAETREKKIFLIKNDRLAR